jgi:hypothetical protein
VVFGEQIEGKGGAVKFTEAGIGQRLVQTFEPAAKQTATCMSVSIHRRSMVIELGMDGKCWLRE